ncbi:unnamed protein product [Periconia digitata]|uniref:CENP-V/GFA domain-containing protein n=1 Tax=Periconia digitata TaxID=1303443 RepID=A0A9W4U587_9PLEO|nr:unnamed protein product [Periconia digitata]
MPEQTSGTYNGSCHCGAVTYSLKLTFPPIHNPAAINSIRIYKCNCSTCQKMGFFHCRPINISDDFILKSPATIEELGDYRTFSKKQSWYFCKDCGVRVFGHGGKWEQTEVDVGEWSGKEKDGKTEKVWFSKPDGMRTRVVDGVEKQVPFHYLSVNAVTLDTACEGGVDLREWHEKGYVAYVENREKMGSGNARLEKPYPGGMF